MAKGTQALRAWPGPDNQKLTMNKHTTESKSIIKANLSASTASCGEAADFSRVQLKSGYLQIFFKRSSAASDKFQPSQEIYDVLEPSRHTLGSLPTYQSFYKRMFRAMDQFTRGDGVNLSGVHMELTSPCSILCKPRSMPRASRLSQRP
eukprot:1158553-Pelagomonas_calceolata.AAC.6